MFAFSGAHRAGKSTLAKIVSERLGLPYLDASVTAELLAAGFDQVSDLDPAARLECQRMRLKFHMEKVLNGPRPAISDRSPLDIAAYTLAEFGMHSDPAIATAAFDLVRECISMTEVHYDALLIVPPLPAYVIEDGKPPANAGFQWHIHYLIMGYALSCRHVHSGVMPTNSLEERVEAAIATFSERLTTMAAWREAAGAGIH